jgi:hypothetical protein
MRPFNAWAARRRVFQPPDHTARGSSCDFNAPARPHFGGWYFKVIYLGN